MSCGHELVWHNCYKSGFDLISPDSFAHPAKMAPSLCFRIIEHLEELGLLNDNDTILDPMSGTGLTAICAGAKGYKAITIELEEKFIGFQRENKEYAVRKLKRELDWTILQGDARKLSELLSERGLVTVSSPPYTETLQGCGADSIRKRIAEGKYQGQRPDVWVSQGNKAGSTYGDGYSKDPNNIGNLADRPLKTVTSPPWEVQSGGMNGTGFDNPALLARHHGGIQKGYGSTSGQIANEQSESYLGAMKIVYAEIAKVSDVLAIVLKNPTRNGKLRRLDLDTIAILEQTGWTIHCQHHALLFEELEQEDMFAGAKKKVKGRMSFFKRLSWQKGQPVAAWEDVIIAVRNGGGNIKVVTSPPYSDAQGHPSVGSVKDDDWGNEGKDITHRRGLSGDYGDTPGQIGNLKDK